MASNRFILVRPRRGARRTRFLNRALPLAFAIGFVAVFGARTLPVLEDLGVTLPSLDSPARLDIVTHAPATRFPMCRGSGRVTCVVDGDTFWYQGETIRIADINTPEISQPQCPAEAALGARATTRLVELLEAGPFTLARSGSRDEDVYGRKLRVVMRDGRSLGDTLVAERLAHTWRGYQESWC